MDTMDTVDTHFDGMAFFMSNTSILSILSTCHCSFVSERFHGIHVGGSQSGVNTKYHADQSGY